MGKLWSKWLPIILFLVGWTAAWVFLWQSYLFELFDREPRQGLTVFEVRSGDVRILWSAAVAGLVLAGVGFFFLVHSSIFRSHSIGWSRTWLVAGAFLTLAGLALPVVYPSARSLVIDEHARTISVERRWLYAERAEAVTFDEIERVNLRVQRILLGSVEGGPCQIGTGLSIVRDNRTWLEVPKGFPHEEVAERVAAIAGAPLVSAAAHEC